MGLFRTVSDTNGDFSQKSHIFCTHMYLVPPLNEFPLELVNTGRTLETRMTELPCRERSLTIPLAVSIQYANVTDRRTDIRTPANSKDRAYA